MKKKFGVFVLIAVLMIAVFRPPIALKAEAIISGEDAMPGPEEKVPCAATLEDEFADDTVLVVLNNAASLSSTIYSASHFPGIGCTGVQNLTQTSTELALAKLNGEGVPAKYQTNSTFVRSPDFFDVDLDSFRRVLCLKLNRADKQNVLNVIAQLENREDVLYAGPDYIMTVNAREPNDAFKNTQDMIDAIGLPAAWDIETGFGGVAVGVIDTGIDYTHPDLRNNVNVGLSRNFLNDRIDQEYSTTLTDPIGHGTHVAGIIGAQGNNSIGVTGVCWNVTLISLKAMTLIEQDGKVFVGGKSSHTMNAIDYAKSCGIPILNLSAGWFKQVRNSSNNIIANPRYDRALEEIIRSYSGLLVCSAGNDDIVLDGSNPYYPAHYNLDNIIVVGSCLSNGNTAENSNVGVGYVDIMAPGSVALSTYPQNLCNSGTHDVENTIHFSNGYHLMSGTSMAAPVVTGVAALMLAKDLTLSTDDIREIIMETVDQRGESITACLSGGVVNAYNALYEVQDRMS